MQEIRLLGSDNLKSEDVTVFCSRSNNGRYYNDVYFLVKESLFNIVMKFEPINGRMRYIVIAGKIFNTMIINGYAPMEKVGNEL